MRTAVVDLRRPVRLRDFRSLFRRRAWDEVLALTPLSAWILEREGVGHLSTASFIDLDALQRECLANLQRLERSFSAAFGPEAESWMGLVQRFKLIANYGLREEALWRRLEDREAWLFADLPHASWQDPVPSRHYLNDASLYFGAVPPERHVLVARNWEGPRLLWRRLASLSPEAVRRKLSWKRKSGTQRCLVTPGLTHDWDPVREPLATRFSLIAPEALAEEALADQPDPSPDAAEAFLKEWEPQYRPLVPRLWPRLKPMFQEKAQEYARLRLALSRRTPELIARHRLAGALGICCDSPTEFLVNYFLKQAGLPVVLYQHGANLSNNLLIGPSEAVPATHNLVYGSADRRLLCRWQPAERVLAVGCGVMPDPRNRRERRGRYLYVLAPNLGNGSDVDSPQIHPVHPVALFERHRRIVELFGSRPELLLTVREHPLQHSRGFYEPLRDLVREKGFRNIDFDDSTVDSRIFLLNLEGVILDYACTTLLHALGMEMKIACFIGRPYALLPQQEELLGGAVACARDEGEFVKLVEDWVSRPRPARAGAARRAFLEAYGGRATPEGVLRFLDPLLASGNRSADALPESSVGPDRR